MAAVGDERFAVRLHTQFRRRTRRFETRQQRTPAELYHFHRNRCALAEPTHELRLVHDDNERGRCAFDDLLPEQSATQALDQIELRIDLVGAVDGEIEAEHAVEL